MRMINNQFTILYKSPVIERSILLQTNIHSEKETIIFIHGLVGNRRAFKKSINDFPPLTTLLLMTY